MTNTKKPTNESSTEQPSSTVKTENPSAADSPNPTTVTTEVPNSPATSTQTETASVAQSASPNPVMAKVSITGAITSETEVAKGTKLSEVFAKLDTSSGYTFRSGGKMVGKETVVNENMTITSTVRGSGG